MTNNRAATFEFTPEDVEKILFPATTTAASVLLTDDYAIKLERLQQKDTRLMLHGTMLSEYFRNKRIPRGLRIQKAPTLGTQDELFMTRWTEILNKCSLDLMLLIIEQVKKESEKMQSEIKQIEEALKTKCGPDFTRIDESLKRNVQEYREKLQQLKLSKYKRDTMDYQQNKVYRWQYALRKEHRRTDHSSSGTESEYIDSDSSLGLQENCFLDPRQPRLQQPRRRNAAGARGRGRGRGRFSSAPAMHQYPTRHKLVQ